MEFSVQHPPALIQVTIQPDDPRQPEVNVVSRLKADDCACVVWLGRRVDNDETCVVSTPCSGEEHRRLLSRFTDLMKWSASGGPETKTAAELVDVCKDLLVEATTEMRAG